MNTDDFDYPLPPERIAQRPAPRGESRLLVLDAEGAARHRTIQALPSLLQPQDLIVVNDTRVIPARLVGKRLPGGGRSELLLLAPCEDVTTTGNAGAAHMWHAMMRPAKRLSPGTRLRFAESDALDALDAMTLEATVVTRAEGGRGTVRFDDDPAPILERVGHVPLPPYIRRPDDRLDRTDYQTVFARQPGAVAAPTAGLHFSPDLLAALDERGIRRAAVTLHVGLGTFLPVTAETAEAHVMETERYEVPAATVDAIRETRGRGGRVVAIGTTVVRTLETAATVAAERPTTEGREPHAGIASGQGRTALFIRPGFRFRVVDALLTNFHLPRSTLLMMISALAGRQRVLDAYQEAIKEGYRFYSYGDAMLLERQVVGGNAQLT